LLCIAAGARIKAGFTPGPRALRKVLNNSRIATLALYIAMAVVVHWIEGFIPRPMPFIRLGLANTFTLCALYLFGGGWGLVVVISRVIVGSIISGSMFNPAFVLSLSGGTTAAIVMWIMPKNIFSPIGVSVAGAVSHMSTQIIIASLIIIRHASLIYFVPLFILISVATGILNGYLAGLIMSMSKAKFKTNSVR